MLLQLCSSWKIPDDVTISEKIGLCFTQFQSGGGPVRGSWEVSLVRQKKGDLFSRQYESFRHSFDRLISKIKTAYLI